MKAPVRIATVIAFCAVLAAGMGCVKKKQAPTSADQFDPDALYQTYIMGVPMLHSDFATSGQFDLAVIGLTFNENVYWATASNTTMAVTCSTGTYTGTINTIVKKVPSLSQIAVQMIMDGSGSMSWNDPSGVRKTAGSVFVYKLNRRNPAHKVAVAEFGNTGYGTDGYYYHLWKDFTAVTDSTGFASTFSQLSYDGATPFYTCVRRSIAHTDSTISAAQYNRAVLALTDGVENDSYPQDSLGAVIALAQSKGIPIYIVGLGKDIDLPGMTRLASYSGGVYAQANVANDLRGIFAVIATSLTQGYNVMTCTVSPVPVSGTNLHFLVRLKDGDLMVAKDVWFKIP